MAQPTSPGVWRPHPQGRATPITESPINLVEQPRVPAATSEAEASQPYQAEASQPYPAADDAAIGDESMTAEEKRTRRRHGSLRGSVSRGVTMLLSRRKSSRAASDTAQNDEEDFEYGEDDGTAEQGGLPMDEQEEDADTNCIVCMDAPRDSTVLPCRHMVLCSRCAGALRYRTDVQHRCPICRTEIESVLEEEQQLQRAMEEMPWGFR